MPVTRDGGVLVVRPSMHRCARLPTLLGLSLLLVAPPHAFASDAGPDLPDAATGAALEDAGEPVPDGGDTMDEEEPDTDDGAPEDGEGPSDGEGAGENPEKESAEPVGPEVEGIRFSRDLDDAQLLQRWSHAPESLGSLSVGFADAGRIINAVPFPEGPLWTVVSPAQAYGLRETVDAVMKAIQVVEERHPGSPRIRVNHISLKDGGYMRPHQSHQSGRDVDLAFYYRGDIPPSFRGKRENVMDMSRNWALIRAFAEHTDVQVILVDRKLQKLLAAQALREGEDAAWVDSIFKGPKALVKHARHHRDHFHVRLVAPRSQELGRRVLPFLARQPDQNRTIHRVRSGDTLGHLAARYGSSITAIKKANGMRNTFLRLGRTLQVPLRGPCNQCPTPPPVVVPPRRVRPVPTAQPETNDAGPPARLLDASQPG